MAIRSNPLHLDTSIGGGGRAFPTTAWSRFLEKTAEDSDSSSSFTYLAEQYWRPIYFYIRIAFGKSNEEAKDLTQTFFIWMMEKNTPENADPERGRFRSFLKACLKHYLLNVHKSENCLKRGGGEVHLSINFPEDTPIDAPDLQAGTPEEVLDRSWRKEVLDQALVRLQESLRGAHEESQFKIFEDRYLKNGHKSKMAPLAEIHGVAPSFVANAIRLFRDRYRRILSDIVAETVRDPQELQNELQSLFGKHP